MLALLSLGAIYRTLLHLALLPVCIISKDLHIVIHGSLVSYVSMCLCWLYCVWAPSKKPCLCWPHCVRVLCTAFFCVGLIVSGNLIQIIVFSTFLCVGIIIIERFLTIAFLGVCVGLIIYCVQTSYTKLCLCWPIASWYLMQICVRALPHCACMPNTIFCFCWPYCFSVPYRKR